MRVLMRMLMRVHGPTCVCVHLHYVCVYERVHVHRHGRCVVWDGVGCAGYARWGRVAVRAEDSGLAAGSRQYCSESDPSATSPAHCTPARAQGLSGGTVGGLLVADLLLGEWHISTKNSAFFEVAPPALSNCLEPAAA